MDKSDGHAAFAHSTQYSLDGVMTHIPGENTPGRLVSNGNGWRSISRWSARARCRDSRWIRLQFAW